MFVLRRIFGLREEGDGYESPVKRVGRTLSATRAKIRVRQLESVSRSPTKKATVQSPMKGRGHHHRLPLLKKDNDGTFDLSQAMEIMLPVEVSARILTYLHVSAFASVPCVSPSWQIMSYSDILWRESFRDRFGLSFYEEQQRLRQQTQKNETLELSFATRTSAREVSQVAPLSPRPRVVIRRIRSTPLSPFNNQKIISEEGTSPRESLSKSSTKTWRERFRRRLESPIVGDAVEVSWHGKFRLESCEVYAGCAWWAANVVDKLKLHDEGFDQWWFKVTFPGWQGRWDEWVPRERLRWPIKSLESKYEGPIRARAQVEVWCSSKNVPGAWLEAKVIKFRNDKYLIGHAQTLDGDPVWVERHRIRLSKKQSCFKQTPPAESGQRLSTRQALLARVGFRSPSNSTETSNNAQGPLPAFVSRGYVDAEDIDDELE